MAAELKKSHGIDVKISPGSSGVFDVIVDGKKIYSKYQSGRFPEPDEIGDIINEPS